MSKEFEPYPHENKTMAFCDWDFNPLPKEKNLTPAEKETLAAKALEALRQEAMDNGYAEGLRQAEAEIDRQKKELAEWIGYLQKPVKLIDDKLIQELLQTILWICQHCIGIELSIHTEKLRGLLLHIKEELPSLKSYQYLAMHPEDAQWITSEMTDKAWPGLMQMITADETLSRGDFYLKGEHSELDGRVHTRLLTLFSQYLEKETWDMPLKPQE